jgi:hypothetical protein
VDDNSLSNIKLPVNHPLFFPHVFALMAKQQHSNSASTNNILEKIIKEEYEEVSRRLDRSLLQESCAVRNVLRTRRLAILLIDNKGELRSSMLPEAIASIKTNLYSLGPNRQYDAVRQEQILKVLQMLHQSKDMARLLKKISKPYANKQADQLIRDTLQLPPTTPITDAHARRATLAAWMCYLRQNVGSCFATAPAEIIHDEQPEKFLADIDEILSTGRLKRTFGGIEYAVPLSPTWGGGDLKKPILMYQTGPDKWMPEIWYSPGILSALTEVDALDKHTTVKQKVAQVKEWTYEMIKNEKQYSHYITLTAETLLRYVLLRKLGITEKNLDEYAHRHQAITHAPLMMRLPKAEKGRGGIGEACSAFHQQFALVKTTFKSIADNALLKAWEFTLASFAETKADFATWNLYSSLGLNPQDVGGIGQTIYEILQNKVTQANEKIQEIQYEYEQVYYQLQLVEGRLRTASTEQELQWIKAEYQSRRHEFRTLEEIRDTNASKAKRFATLFDVLVNHYLSLFKDYFQEVYDADMHDVQAGPFDDSPAGFRLLYKHGRSNTSLWTRIQNSTEFIDSLSSFFVATEPHITADETLAGLERDISEIVTAVINQVKTKEFLETAFYRMAAAHKTPMIKDPLEHLDKIEKKPWAYTSGGTMNTLISCYYKRIEKPTEVGRWVDSETDLLTFLIDTVRQIPPASIDDYLNKKRSSMLIHSPTHAFLLKPCEQLFMDGWTNHHINTYIWARDHFIAPSQQFIDNISLDEETLKFLIEQLLEKVPYAFQHYFKKTFNHLYGSMNPWEFRHYLLDTMQSDRGLNIRGKPVLSADEIDSFLYSHAPFFKIEELEERLKAIFTNLPGIHQETIKHLMDLYDQMPHALGEYRVLGAAHLQNICKALLCLAAQSTSKGVNYHVHVSETVQKLGYAMPKPIIFADTNWMKDLFGFVVNPGTSRLELWRVDCTGTVGNPMSAWKQWVDGSRHDLTWGVYTKPQEYS